MILFRRSVCNSDLISKNFVFNCNICPDYDCSLKTGNGFFRLKISLKGSSANPPYLSRLYCRNNKIGRFVINLDTITCRNMIIISGETNVRCGDIIEWNHKNIRHIGIVDNFGSLLKLNMFYSCDHFQKSLKKYLQTKDKKYIEQFIGNKAFIKTAVSSPVNFPVNFPVN